MALKHILTLAFVLLPSVSNADRASETSRAREAILASGSFQNGVGSSDPACRQEVMDIINRDRTAPPFQYNRVYMYGIGRSHGAFVPLSSYHNIDETYIMNSGGEYIHINDRAWRCTRKSGWEEYIPPLRGKASWQANFAFLGFVAAPYDIGGARCLGETYVDNVSFCVYEFNVYSEVQADKRRMYVEVAIGLPTIIEILDNSFKVAAKITRTYDKGIAIAPPAGACSFPIMNERF